MHLLGNSCSLVDHMLSSILTICNIFISRFGFEGWIWILIATVPDLCILFTFEMSLCLQHAVVKAQCIHCV